MKPEPPPYPRPVPSIDFDEDPILPGTIVYTNDNETNDNERAAKRRRIEANANAYLRGEGLFILSASLRGPFNAGWKNPWAPKSKKRKAGAEEEPPPNKRARILPNDRKRVPIPNAPTTFDRIRQSVPSEENPFARTIRSSEPPSNDEKVESWLRRNSALPQDSFVVPTSPTPKKKASVPGSNKTSKPAWTPTKQRITVNSQDIKAPLHQVPSRVADSFDTIVRPGQQPAATHHKLQTAPNVPERAQASRQNHKHISAHCPVGVNDTGEKPVRAEQAILNLKRKSEEPSHKQADALMSSECSRHAIEDHGPSKAELTTVVQSASVPVKQLAPVAQDSTALKIISKDAPEPETSKQQTIISEVKLKELDTSINEQLQSNQHDNDNEMLKVSEPPAANGTSVPIYSTAVSELQSIKLPPSAQHKPELQTSTSNISSGALLPDVPVDHKKIATLTTVPSDLSEQAGDSALASAAVQDKQTSKDVQVQILAQGASGEEENQALEKTSPRHGPPGPVHEEVFAPQQLTHLPVCEPDARMAQTSLDASVVRTPISVQKVKSSKRTKKTSFAAETSFTSSHGSIKSVLKVQKSDVVEKAQKHTPPALSFSKSIDMDTSLEQGEVSSKHNSPAETWKRPKSILKTRSTHSSPAAARASAMLSERHREGSSFSRTSNRDIQPGGQNGILPHQQAEEFDLEGAMDDLGSFLSTWDAEKESLHAM